MSKKYIEFDGKQLLHLSEMIILSYFNDELILVVVHGKQGYGKSSYVSIVKSQVYGVIEYVEQHIKDHPEVLHEKTEAEIRRVKIKIFRTWKQSETFIQYDWKTTREMFVFTPRQFLTLSRSQKTKKPCSCVDDAGLWLNSMDYNNPLVKAVGKFFEVARTKWGAILFTCSDLKQVFTKIRNMPHVYTVRITKYEGKTHPNRRIATIFEGWTSEDLKKSGRKTRAIDMFYAQMPDKFYNWYKPERDRLADQGLNEIEVILNNLGI